MRNKNQTRRVFIRNLSVAALVSASLPLLSSCTKEEAEDFLQKHFLEMTEEEKKQVFAKLEQRYLERYGRKFQISTQNADLLGRGPGYDRGKNFALQRKV